MNNIKIITDLSVKYADSGIGIIEGTNDWYYHCNSYGYWAVIYSEALKNVKHLYVRVTCENNDIDSSALQLASAEFKENFPPEKGLYDPNEQLKAANSGALENCTNGKETNISAEESWSGKIFSIDEDLLQGKSIPERALYWHYPHYGNQGGEPSSIIRQGDWKLIHYYEHRFRTRQMML